MDKDLNDYVIGIDHQELEATNQEIDQFGEEKH
jgi:hypothetical protein